jgi:CheY-like chemotaxis protein
VEAKRSARQAPPATGASGVRTGPRVLVVDDERPIRDIVAEALRDTGYEVATAANGAEALRRIADARPDVIVLDLMMPVMDAAGFTHMLRLNPTSAGVPIIILSAAYAPYDEATRLGATACLTKPFAFEELLATVERAIAPAGLAAPLPPTPARAAKTPPGQQIIS